MKTLWFALVIGIWIFLSGLFPGLITVVNLIISGILAIIFGLMPFYSDRSLWQGLIIGLIGVWLIISALIGLLLSWNFLLFGFLVAVLALWGALTTSRRSAETRL